MKDRFIVASPYKGSSVWFARALQRMELLDKYLVGRCRLPGGIDSAISEKLNYLALPEYLVARCFKSNFATESARFAMTPFFDRWAKRRMLANTNLFAGFGYMNESSEWIQQNGGKVFLEAGNSHPEYFWNIISEEYNRWGYKRPPIPSFHNRRQRRSVELADYVFAPSKFVENSFLEHGFSRERVLKLPYPVDTEVFKPSENVAVQDEFVIMCSGQVSLRKGSPYLFDAFRRFHKDAPNSRLRILNSIADNMKPLMKSKFCHMKGVEWFNNLSHPQLAEMLRGSSVFAIPSIEEGMVRTAIEAMATGLPIIVTPNTGVNDHVEEGINGSVVPIRDVDALVDRFQYWYNRWENDRTGYKASVLQNIPDLGLDVFQRSLSSHIKKLFN